MSMPIIAATDTNTDLGTIIEENKCGIKVNSGDIDTMLCAINKIVDGDIIKYKEACQKLLVKEFLTNRSYQLILEKVKHV
jgi:DNA-directed RNA polymerase subunit E'/Rpb7